MNEVDVFQPSVLFISDLDVWSMGQGTGGPALSRILQAYVQAGWKVVFVTGSGRESRQELPGVHVVRFGARGLKRWFSIRRLGAVARAIWWVIFQTTAIRLGLQLKHEYSFDVVYGYEIKGVPAARYLSRSWRIPLVTRFQGCIIPPSGPGVWKKYLKAWDHWLALRTPADLVIMTNDGTQGDQNLREVGADMSNVRFWMNGTDKDEFVEMPSRQRARADLRLKRKNVILMLSRLVWWKCVERGIKAMPSVLRTCPDTQLLIVGDGVERSRLERLANDLGIGNYVRFTGAVSRQEIKSFLAASDIFLSLNTLSNVGNPLLEAMLAGRCIVTLATGDTAQVVQHGATGVLLPEDGLSWLPDELIALLKNPARMADLGANARDYARRHFLTWNERTSMEITEVEELMVQYRRGFRQAAG